MLLFVFSAPFGFCFDIDFGSESFLIFMSNITFEFVNQTRCTAWKG